MTELSASGSFPVDVVAMLRNDEENVAQLLTDYFDPRVGFTGRYFEQMIERSNPYEFTPWDLAAVSALSVDVPPDAAAQVLLRGHFPDQVNDLLHDIPLPSVELSDADDDDIGDHSTGRPSVPPAS